MCVCVYVCIYIYEQCRMGMGKSLVNTKNFPTSFICGRSQVACCLYDF